MKVKIFELFKSTFRNYQEQTFIFRDLDALYYDKEGKIMFNGVCSLIRTDVNGVDEPLCMIMSVYFDTCGKEYDVAENGMTIGMHPLYTKDGELVFVRHDKDILFADFKSSCGDRPENFRPSTLTDMSKLDFYKGCKHIYDEDIIESVKKELTK